MKTYTSPQSLTRLGAPLSRAERAERIRIQAELERLLGPRSEGELQLLQGRVLIATRQNRNFMALSDAISNAICDRDVPDTHACWERSDFLADRMTLPVVRRFVASLRPATRGQYSLAKKLGIALPKRCSSVEAGHQMRCTLHARRLRRERV